MNQLNNILVSFDLHLIKDYPRIYKAISALDFSISLGYSTWYVRSAADGQAVFKYLLSHIDNDDALVVIDSTNNILRGVVHSEPQILRAVENLWLGGSQFSNQLNNMIVSYDLHLIKDYPRLYKAISALGVALRLNDSTWYVRSASNVQAAFNDLLAHIDNDDALIVIDATNNILRGVVHSEPETLRFVENLWRGGRYLSAA